jgi:hypothetical protein
MRLDLESIPLSNFVSPSDNTCYPAEGHLNLSNISLLAFVTVLVNHRLDSGLAISQPTEYIEVRSQSLRAEVVEPVVQSSGPRESAIDI